MENRQTDLETDIDTARSKLSVRVGKAGLLRVLGHEHRVEAQISHGWIKPGLHAGAEIAVDAHRMTVLPEKGISPENQAKIQAAMEHRLLEADMYPEIEFASTKVTPAGQDAFVVKGLLTLHGIS